MSRKITFLVICLFLFTGCDITYNLEISDDNYVEKAIIVEDDVSLFYSDEVEKQFYNNYTNVPIPMSKYDPIPTNFNGNGSFQSKEEGYYESKKLTDNSKVGMQYEGVFTSDNIVDSRLINEAIPDSLFKVDNNNINLSASNLGRLFIQIPSLDKIIVNINVKGYTVTKNNADNINNNIYTWNISKNNYKNKTIELKVSKNKQNNSFIEQIINICKNNKIIILVIGIIILSSFLYFFVKRIQERKNLF